MRYPPRLGHLATRAVVVAKLVPTYAAAHAIDDDEARTRLDAALSGALLGELLASAWESLQGGTKRLTEDGLLEKVAKSLQDRPLRPGRKVEASAGWSAFLVLADLAAGTASEAARRVMETEAGQVRARAGLAEVGGFLARELTR
jgi:hypothetical protein